MSDPVENSVRELPQYRSGLVAALDVGSSKVACMVARAEPDQLRILGAAMRKSHGMRVGQVVNLAEVETAIGEAISEAEAMADERVQNVLISVNCGSPAGIVAGAEMDIDGDAISDDHIGPLLAEGRRQCYAEGYELIQSEPTGYVVDDAHGVRDPSGLVCQKLGVRMFGVAVKSPPLTNLKQAVMGCHVGVALSLFAPYASGLAVLTEDEKKLGATVIDMGGGVTSVAVFRDGHLAYVDVVPLGGLQVTADLARMLSTPMAAAERIKVLYGAALGARDAAPADEVPVPQMGEEGEESEQHVPRSMLTRIIHARLEEIFSEVQKKLRASGFDVAAGRRAVLTGGASQMAGVRELARQVLNKEVRVARPISALGLPASASGPDYATVAGLIAAGASRDFELLNPEIPILTGKQGRKSFLARLTEGLFG